MILPLMFMVESQGMAELVSHVRGLVKEPVARALAEEHARATSVANSSDGVGVGGNCDGQRVIVGGFDDVDI